MHAQATTFKHEPDHSDRRKHVQILCRSDRLFGAIQTIRQGGENNLHSHPNLDGLWFVLEGGARFYTTGDELVADLRTGEGVFVPRGYPYWFESVGDDALRLLHIEASAKPHATLAEMAR